MRTETPSQRPAANYLQQTGGFDPRSLTERAVSIGTDEPSETDAFDYYVHTRNSHD